MRFIFKTRYQQDVDHFKHSGQRFWIGLLLLVVLLAPIAVDRFYLGELAMVFIYAIAGIGLMLLVGYTGLVSLGHAAFLAVGAYCHSWLLGNGVPLPLAMVAATLVTAGVGAVVGVPALRMTGIYLAVATLALAVIVEKVLEKWEAVTGGLRGWRELTMDTLPEDIEVSIRRSDYEAMEELLKDGQRVEVEDRLARAREPRHHDALRLELTRRRHDARDPCIHAL